MVGRKNTFNENRTCLNDSFAMKLSLEKNAIFTNRKRTRQARNLTTVKENE